MFRRSDKASHDAGYTLVELLVVIAVASLMLTAVPAFASRLLPSARFDARFEALKDELNETRARATASGETLVFEVEDFDEALAFKSDALTGSETSALRFYGGDGATGGILVLKDERRARALEINWLTGRAREIEVPQ